MIRRFLAEFLGALCVFAIPYLFALIAYGAGFN